MQTVFQNLTRKYPRNSSGNNSKVQDPSLYHTSMMILGHRMMNVAS